MGIVRFIADRITAKKESLLKELSLAGLLNTEVGEALIEINKVLFAIEPEFREDVLILADKVRLGMPLSSLDDPAKTSEFIIVDQVTLKLQSTRLPSLFSTDKGLTWYDIDIFPRHYLWWTFINGIFGKPKWMQNFMRKRLLYHVEFPYDQCL